MAQITHVFVLMLENRSFDNLLGFSGITGTDAATGQPTKLNGLSGTESNSYLGQTYTVSQPANQTLAVDPGHEFPDVLEQLAGREAVYTPGGAYPPIDKSGFVSDYAFSGSPEEGNAPNDFGAVMRCYSPTQLPVLNALAREFAVCDSWHSSLPGPTWPNRFFAHAATSGGLDTSPTTEQMGQWELTTGLSFQHGTIFDALDASAPLGGFSYRIFAGQNGFEATSPVSSMPIVTALNGVSKFGVDGIDAFCSRVQYPVYPWAYTFLEPDYGDVMSGTFQGGNSQHPMDGVTPGEALIKQVYEAIRSSPYWNTSLLIITWDEHGGLYDHVTPPAAVAPGDSQPRQGLNTYGFTFQQYGVRVPAVVVSPLIPKNLVDHRLYDHSSIPATLEKLFGLSPLTARDRQANDVTRLLTLSQPRTDTPLTLPNPAQFTNVTGVANTPKPPAPNSPMLPTQQGFVLLAAKHDLELAPPGSLPAVQARVAAIKTVAQAGQYIAEVNQRSQQAQRAVKAREAVASAAKSCGGKCKPAAAKPS
jgi:phospholipase C